MRFHSPMLATAFFGLLLGVFAARANAEDGKVELLWPKGAPDAKGETDNDKPTITIFRPEADKANRAAVIVCPGGGYQALAMDYEGTDVAKWFATQGVTAVVLKYRHVNMGYKHPTPMHDAQRAVRLVRSKAKEWNIGSDKIGIMGFSAGGHLAATVGTHNDAGKKDAEDPIERESCRPDFMILAYPVISFINFAHEGSRNNLIGKDADQKLVENLSLETQVTDRTPPTFMFHTSDDNAVHPENSVMFYSALRKKGVYSELHVFRHGRHGVGMAQNDPALKMWPGMVIEWMKGSEYIQAKK